MYDKKGSFGILFLLALVVFGACTTDGYEAGDGEYSYLRADFCMLHTSDTVLADRAVTDEGETVVFKTPTKVKWAVKRDTLYRALIHYDANTKKLFSASRVLVIRPTVRALGKTYPADPLNIETVWIAGGYLNIGFALKSGVADSIGVKQTIGLLLDAPVSDGGGQRTIDLTMIHAQNGVPEYYTVRGYMSMPLSPELRGTTIRLSVNSYAGPKVFNLQY